MCWQCAAAVDGVANIEVTLDDQYAATMKARSGTRSPVSPSEPSAVANHRFDEPLPGFTVCRLRMHLSKGASGENQDGPSAAAVVLHGLRLTLAVARATPVGGIDFGTVRHLIGNSQLSDGASSLMNMVEAQQAQRATSAGPAAMMAKLMGMMGGTPPPGTLASAPAPAVGGPPEKPDSVGAPEMAGSTAADHRAPPSQNYPSGGANSGPAAMIAAMSALTALETRMTERFEVNPLPIHALPEGRGV